MCLPDEIVGAGSGCGLLGGGSERALVLLAECVDGGVIVGGGGPASLGSRLSADRLQTGAAQVKKKKSQTWESFAPSKDLRFNVLHSQISHTFSTNR